MGSSRAKDLMHDQYRRVVRFWVMPPLKPEKRPSALRFGILGITDSAYTILIKPAEHNPYVVVTAVASHNRVKCKDFCKRYSIPKQFTIYQELLEDPHIDAVLITSGMHYAFEWTMRSLAQGKHVLLDSPGVGTVAHAARLFNSPMLRGPLPFYPVFSEVMPFRFHPSWLEFERAIDRGHIAHVKVSIVLPVTFDLDKDIRFRFEHAGGSRLDVSFGLTLLRSVFGTSPVSCAQSRIDLSRRTGEWEGDYEHDSVWQFPQGGIGEVMGTARLDSRLSVPVLCSNAGITVEVRHFTQTLAPWEWAEQGITESPGSAAGSPEPPPPPGSAWEIQRSVKLRWVDGPPSQHSIVVKESGTLYHSESHRMIRRRSKKTKLQAYRLGRKEELGASGVTGEVPVPPAPEPVVQPSSRESSINLRNRNSTVKPTKKPAPEPVKPHRLLRSKPWWTAPMYQLDSFVNRILTSRNPDVAKSVALSTIQTGVVPPPWIPPTDGLGHVAMREAAYAKAKRAPRTSACVGWESAVRRMKFGARLLGIEPRNDDSRDNGNRGNNSRDNGNRGNGSRDNGQDDGGSESDDGGGNGGGGGGVVSRTRRNVNPMMTGAASAGAGEGSSATEIRLRDLRRQLDASRPPPTHHTPAPAPAPAPAPDPVPVPVPPLDAQGLPVDLPEHLRTRLSAGLSLAHELGVVPAVTGPEAAAFVLPWLHGLPNCEWVPDSAVDSRFIPSEQEKRWFRSMHTAPPQPTTAVAPMDSAFRINLDQPYQEPGPWQMGTRPSSWRARRAALASGRVTSFAPSGRWERDWIGLGRSLQVTSRTRNRYTGRPEIEYETPPVHRPPVYRFRHPLDDNTYQQLARTDENPWELIRSPGPLWTTIMDDYQAMGRLYLPERPSDGGPMRYYDGIQTHGSLVGWWRTRRERRERRERGRNGGSSQQHDGGGPQPNNSASRSHGDSSRQHGSGSGQHAAGPGPSSAAPRPRGGGPIGPISRPIPIASGQHGDDSRHHGGDVSRHHASGSGNHGGPRHHHEGSRQYGDDSRRHDDDSRHHGSSRNHDDGSRRHGDSRHHHNDGSRHPGDDSRRHGDSRHHGGDSSSHDAGPGPSSGGSRSHAVVPVPSNSDTRLQDGIPGPSNGAPESQDDGPGPSDSGELRPEYRMGWLRMRAARAWNERLAARAEALGRLEGYDDDGTEWI